MAPNTSEVTSLAVRLLGPGETAVLERVAPEVFDNRVVPGLATEFLADPRHHLAVAIEGDTVVGFASAVHYVHPDKAPALWVNEVGVAPTHQRCGIGRRLLHALLERARELECGEAWVLTDTANAAARRLYATVGGVEAPEPVVMVTFALGTDRGRTPE